MDEAQALPALLYKLQTLRDDLCNSNSINQEFRDNLLYTNRILSNKEDYFYQFTDRASRLGFMSDASFLQNTSEKILSFIAINADKEVILKNTEQLCYYFDAIIHFLNTEINLKDTMPFTYIGEQLVKRRIKKTIFISYSHQDKISTQIIDGIKRSLYNVVNIWVDKYNLRRHQKIPEELSEAINNACGSIIIASHNFFDSNWCNEEWNALFMKKTQEQDFRFYIIRIDDADYPPLLSSYYYTDCRGFPSLNTRIELNKLLEEIYESELYRDWIETVIKQRIKCPFCEGLISDYDTICRHCGKRILPEGPQ